MKKILLAILFTILLLPIKCNAAGSITVSPTSLTMNVNESKTININAVHAFGIISISSSDTSIATVSSSKEFIDNPSNSSTSLKITITGKKAGTATIRVVCTDGATYDDEEISPSYNIKVTVASPITTTTTVKPVVVNTTTTKAQVQTTKNQNNQTQTTKKTTTAKNNNTTVATTQNSNDEQQFTTSVTVPSTEPITIEEPNYNQLKEFKVIGYEIKENDGKYVVSIPEEIDEVYVLATSEYPDVEIQGDGVVNIAELDQIVIKTIHGEEEKEYVIEINKIKDNTLLLSIIIAALVAFCIYIFLKKVI